MFRLIKLQNFMEYIVNTGLIRYHLYRHYGQHYDSLTYNVLQGNQMFCTNASNTSDTGSDSGTTNTTTTMDNKKDNVKNKNVTETRRRKYLRNMAKNRLNSEENALYKVSWKNRSRNEANTAIEKTSNATIELSKTDSNNNNNSNYNNSIVNIPNNKINNEIGIEKVNEKKDQNQSIISIIKKELPLNKVHIEYMETKTKNVNDIMMPLKNDDDYNNSQKTEETEEMNPLKQLEKQLNDPMLIKLIKRSQLVPQSMKPHKTSHNYTPNMDDLEASKANSSWNAQNDNNTQMTTTENINKIQSYHANNKREKSINDTATEVDYDMPKIRINIPFEETIANVNNSKKEEKEITEIDSKSYEMEAATTKKLITKPEEPFINPFTETEDITAKRLYLRAKTEKKLQKKLEAKLSKGKKLQGIQSNTNNWYAKKVDNIKLKVKGCVENTTTPTVKTPITITRKTNVKSEAKSKENVSKSNKEDLTAHKIDDNLKNDQSSHEVKTGYKDQSHKLAEIMSGTNVQSNIMNNKTIVEHKKDGIRDGSGSSRNSRNVKGRGQNKDGGGTASKVYSYVRNVCYFLMSLVGSYGIYCVADILSRNENDETVTLSHWPMQDVIISVDDDNHENQKNSKSTEIETLEVSSKQNQGQSLVGKNENEDSEEEEIYDRMNNIDNNDDEDDDHDDLIYNGVDGF